MGPPPPQNVPATAASVPSAVPPGSQYPPATVKPSQLDNPPRTRVFSIGTAAGPVKSAANPFSGLTGIDIFNVKEALQARLAALNADPSSNPDHLNSTNRVLVLAQALLMPKPAALPGESVPRAAGVTPMPPVPRP